MSADAARTTIGLPAESHSILKQLKEDGVFADMMDGARFAIALALANGRISPDNLKCETVWNIGTFDPDGLIRDAIIELCPDSTGSPYSVAERLADWGISELGRRHTTGELRFTELLMASESVAE